MSENNYLDLMQNILEAGEFIENDRTGVGIYSWFGTMLRFDLTQGFPAITTKKLAWRAVVGELLWFLEGSMNVNRLREITFGPGSSKRTIWDDNYDNQAKNLGYSNGYLGPVYGRQWRDFQGVDQIQQLIKDINKSKESGIHNRRLLVSAWNPPELDKMALPPCHYAFQLLILPIP
ncbi:TPA: thymidylate synthase [Klebsiella pneumoniae]|uniref:thymidylate synthase n=2 Tax=Enterobacteriaceae TaxID=543 RepID=A0A2R4KLT5_ECOLX|nr:Thymydilate synthase [Escherichia coli]UHA81041.1 Thymidylate synthase [Klebsiella pneumoniae]UHP21182.1 Thymidylate synthase [Klebsiella pneumoniae]